MKLTSEHRQDLIAALDKAQEEADNYKRLVNSGKYQVFTFEAYHFLAIKRIELIKQSLIDNKIDY